MLLSISHPGTFLSCNITLPASKSVFNRLLIISFLAGKHNPYAIESDISDVRIMQKLLGRIQQTTEHSHLPVELDVEDAGTVMRFLIATLAVTPGKWILTGTARMQQRPVKYLVDALLSMGFDIRYLKAEGFPPLAITGNANNASNHISIKADISSQYISALMMIMPILKNDSHLDLLGDIASAPYIHMTASLMKNAGAQVVVNDSFIKISSGGYSSASENKKVEPDWSAAAFWYSIVALSSGGEVFLEGLTEKSIQGDSVAAKVFSHLGIKSQFSEAGLRISSVSKPEMELNFDFNECPDLAQPVIVCCAALGVTGRFTGLNSLRVKETDRIAALVNELTACGFNVTNEGNDILLNKHPENFVTSDKNVLIRCYNDHRMAMAFAPLALRFATISVDDKNVVSKSYPGFWTDIAQAGFLLSSRH